MLTNEEFKKRQDDRYYLLRLGQRRSKLSLDEFVQGKLPVTATVRCGGKHHNIWFDGKHLVLLNHPNINRDRLLVGMGDKCRCLEVLDGWRKVEASRIPPALCESFYGIRMAGKNEAKHRVATFSVKSIPSNRYWLPATTAELIVKQWAQTSGELRNYMEKISYNQKLLAVSPFINSMLVRPTTNVSQLVNVQPHVDVISSTNGVKKSCTLYLYVRPSWRRTVLEEGLGDIDGHLILDVCRQVEVDHYRKLFGEDYADWPRRPWWSYLAKSFNHKKTVVLAVMPTAQTVYAKPAEVVVDPDDGTRKLKWIESTIRKRKK